MSPVVAPSKAGRIPTVTGLPSSSIS